MGCKASKPVYTLHVQPTRLSLTESMNRFGGSDEKVEGSMSARRSSRRNSRRKSNKRLQSAHRTSMGKITARAGSFAEGHLQRQFAVSSFEMGKVCWLPHRCGRYTILVVLVAVLLTRWCVRSLAQGFTRRSSWRSTSEVATSSR